jgi:uncharacterized protein
MDRVFLDANVLFSAAYRPDAGLLGLWNVEDCALYTSRYAIEEARINLDETAQRERLDRLCQSLQVVDAVLVALPPDISLPKKDGPILAAAIAANATHLLTGDVRHFGRFLGKRVAGVLIQLPGDYLRGRK